MKIKELEEKSGLTRDTIRYYEKIKVLNSPARGMNGYREYSKDHLNDLLFIKSSKRIGLSLDEIRLALANMRKLGRLCDGVKDDLGRKKKEIRQEIKEKENALKEIDKILKRHQERSLL
ncbi:MerR family transcriptional regulator [Halobacteriovorax sp. GFR7]|uniref:MerR family transcriptional regulator n=1 Tax=unclassified Halobacteriovorax TaxID=2639665 RepID=UPI003D979D04